ncbi:hypothetical protein RJ641_036334 [Dillenia turbinata]|uniref:Uncharacterized protein n=1 Tax=Dillenia turbinata TaxID=194707 RepID=A0AAN8VG37_9MAGN
MYIHVFLVGINLRDFVLTNCDGKEVKDAVVLNCTLVKDLKSELMTVSPWLMLYSPQKQYVSAHDNQTPFDIVSLKTPTKILVDDRCRMNHLATSIIAFSQKLLERLED